MTPATESSLGGSRRPPDAFVRPGGLRRDGHLDASAEAAALRALDRLRGGRYEVLPGESVRALAMRVLRLHPLRSADALQLAAALEWSGATPGGVLVTFDDRFARSAELEGFQLP